MDADDIVPPTPDAPRGTRHVQVTSFFRENYRTVLRDVMYAGATEHQADEATQLAMIDIAQRWDVIASPLAYARRAAIRHFIKLKQRDARRRGREVDYATSGRQHEPDFWSDDTAVSEILAALTPGQREVVELLVEDLSQAEIAEALGRTYDAVRRSLSDTRKQVREVLEQRRGTGTERKEAR